MAVDRYKDCSVMVEAVVHLKTDWINDILASGVIRRQDQGLTRELDPTKPPKNFRDAMSREDPQEGAEVYNAEHQGFYEHQTLKIARPEPDAKILGTTTHCEWAINQAQGAIVCDG